MSDTSKDKGSGPGAIQKLLNMCVKAKLEPPAFDFKEEYLTRGKSAVSQWSGEAKFLDVNYSCLGKTKKDVKNQLCINILSKVLVDRGGDSDLRVNALQLSSSLPSTRKRRGERSQEVRDKRKRKFIEKLSLPVKVCGICKRDNFVHLDKCSTCEQKLSSDAITGKPVFIFLDIERTAGPQTSEPISLGMVAVENKEVKSEKEIVVLPSGQEPRKNSYVSKINNMYVGVEDGKKEVFKMVKGGRDYTLPSVPPEEAAEEMMQFLRNLAGQGNIKALLFHGDDELCLLPFLKSAGLEDEFHMIVSKLLDTRHFFETIQEGKRVGMKTIVQDHGSEEDKQLYSAGAHSAVVDAKVLASLCFSLDIGPKFESWAEDEKSLLKQWD